MTYLTLLVVAAAVWAAAAAMYALTVRINARRQQQQKLGRQQLPVTISREDMEKLGLQQSLLCEMASIAVSPRSPAAKGLATRRNRSADGSGSGSAAGGGQADAGGFCRAAFTGALKAAIQQLPGLGGHAAPSRLSSCSSSVENTPRDAPRQQQQQAQQQQAQQQAQQQQARAHVAYTPLPCLDVQQPRDAGCSAGASGLSLGSGGDQHSSTQLIKLASCPGSVASESGRSCRTPGTPPADGSGLTVRRTGSCCSQLPLHGCSWRPDGPLAACARARPLSPRRQRPAPAASPACPQPLQSWEHDVIQRYSSLDCPTPAHKAIVERLQRSAMHKLNKAAVQAPPQLLEAAPKQDTVVVP